MSKCVTLWTLWNIYKLFFTGPVDCVRGHVAATMLMFTLFFARSIFTSLQRQHRILLNSPPFITWWFTSFCDCPHYKHPHTIIFILSSKHLSWFVIIHSYIKVIIPHIYHLSTAWESLIAIFLSNILPPPSMPDYTCPHCPPKSMDFLINLSSTKVWMILARIWCFPIS